MPRCDLHAIRQSGSDEYLDDQQSQQDQNRWFMSQRARDSRSTRGRYRRAHQRHQLHLRGHQSLGVISQIRAQWRGPLLKDSQSRRSQILCARSSQPRRSGPALKFQLGTIALADGPRPLPGTWARRQSGLVARGRCSCRLASMRHYSRTVSGSVKMPIRRTRPPRPMQLRN